jgi:hypothetical protein
METGILLTHRFHNERRVERGVLGRLGRFDDALELL